MVSRFVSTARSSPAAAREPVPARVSSYSGTRAHFGTVEGFDLHVELDAPGAGPDAQRLDGAVLVPGERDRALGELVHGGPVPLEAEQVCVKEFAETPGRPAPLGVRGYLHDPDLRFLHQQDGPAEGFGEQLVAQAHPEIGPSEIGHPVPDGGLLGDQPRMLGLSPTSIGPPMTSNTSKPSRGGMGSP